MKGRDRRGSPLGKNLFPKLDAAAGGNLRPGDFMHVPEALGAVLALGSRAVTGGNPRIGDGGLQLAP